MSLGGRPREEGGHKAYKLSFDKLTSEGLEKIRKGGSNISKIIEQQLKPVIETLDPGEASIHVWRYEVYLAQQIIKAAQENKPETIQALASIANALRDFRNLCGIPPLDSELFVKATKSKDESWRVELFKEGMKYLG